MSKHVLRGAAAIAFLCAMSGAALAEVTVSDADNGKTISVAAGDKLVVKLAGKHDSGNTWFLDADLTPELILSGRTTDSVAVSGAPETTTFTFTTGTPGEVTFRASYRKDAEPMPEKSDVSITVDVGTDQKQEQPQPMLN